ncbi:2045_t:CDS:2 [Entrophospora sp. SA101]|nr:14103_t:CDS:2 [Entrophospora sp. SA101]CAJ0836274.1 2045_t:CDS:2 [Entrophospora sp. SA101]
MAEKELEIIYQRIDLDYELKALEPYIPEKIMNDHYHGNHQGYENNLNLILAKLEKEKREYLKNNYSELKKLLQNLNQLTSELALAPEIKEAIRFHAGGLINHNYFFWHLAKNKINTSKAFLEALRDSGFDSLDPQSDLKDQLIKQALDPTINEKKQSNQGLELQVSECFYDNQIINKITLKHNHKILTSAENNQFIIKNIQSNEIEFKPSSKKITKIRLSGADDQDQKIIEENKNEYFFTIGGIKKYELLPAIGKTQMLVLSADNFRDLEKSVLFQPEPVKIFVKNPKKNINHYLIKCQGDLAKIGLKDYQKIRIIFHQEINDGDIIEFKLTNLKDILQRDKEDGILRIDNSYHSFAKIKTGSAVSAQEQAQKTIQKQGRKFLKKYQNEQAERVNSGQKSLEKYSQILQQLRDKFNDPTSRELIDQKNSLSQKLAEFASQSQLENKIALLERQIFFTMTDYQDQSKNDQFKQGLAKIDQEFTELTEEIAKFQTSLREHLKEKWVLVYEQDPQLQQLFAKHKVSQQEDGSIDYLALEKYLQEQNSRDGLPNNLGYFPHDLKEGTEHKKIIKDSQSEKLAENILEIQKKRFTEQAKTYFKTFIEQELEKVPVGNTAELGKYSTYAQEIEKKESWEKLESYLERVITKVNRVRENKISSLERNQIKRAKDQKDLTKRIASRQAEKKNWLLVWQINKYLRCYQELQEEAEQDYFSQRLQLKEVERLLEKIDKSSLNSEQIELQRTLQKITEPLMNLYVARGFQRNFNEATSAKEKQEKLTEKEAQIQKQIEQNLRLIQQGKATEKFVLINEKPTELEMLTLEPEVQGENDSTTESTKDQD